MGFWFKSRYRYILLSSISLPVLLILLKMRAGKYDLALTAVVIFICLSSQLLVTTSNKLQFIQFSSYVFSSWALHYIFMYLIIIVLAQLLLKVIK